jgi:hypothetical protein
VGTKIRNSFENAKKDAEKTDRGEEKRMLLGKERLFDIRRSQSIIERYF